MFNAEDEKGVFSRVQTRGVALRQSSDRPLMQVATEEGISPSMLRNWRGDAPIEDDTGPPLDAVASGLGVGDHAAEA